MAARTRAAMYAEAPVVYQATFELGRWRGHADFLERVEKETDLVYLRQARDNRAYYAMADEVKDLRRQLTEARRRSANRMLRIKALKERAGSPLDAMNAPDHIPAAQDP